MRLTKEQAQTLKTSILTARPTAKVYLFGSRVYDDKKGGDIDILILDETSLSISEKVQIERTYWKKYGEQKIDLICFSPTSAHPFKQVALQDAIRI